MVIRWARASWLRAGEFFGSDGVTVEQVMTDNAFAYRNAEVFQGARTRCAAGRLRGFGVDPPSGRPPAERARRADPRVSRDGGMTNQSFGPLRVS